MSILQPTPYQSTVLSIPASWNIFMGGGRGGGKSTASLLLILRHVEQHGAAAHPLIVRETYKAVTELAEQLHQLFVAAYGKSVRFNKAEGMFRLPNGAIVEVGQLDGPRAYAKFQGRSFTLLIIDEYGLIKDPRWVAMLKSNLRAADGIPLRCIYTANPGGPLHAYIHQNYIAQAPSWQPFELDGETFVCANSTMDDNPHLAHADYDRKLKAACGNDEELYRAWRHGDWNIARGAFFGGTLREDVHMLPVAWPYALASREDRKLWRPFISHDYGSSAPSVTFLCLKAPGGIGPFPRNSLILVDELATVDPNDPNVGLGWPPGKLAEAIIEMCEGWGIKSPDGVGDDAVGFDRNLLGIFEDYGINLNKPEKGRIAGWAATRAMLHEATRPNEGRPGMWISARCKYFWKTVPFIERDPSRPEDVLTTGPDHAADAARYAVMECNGGPSATFSRHTGII